MPPKKQKKNTKFKKVKKESLVQFVARVVISIGKPVTVDEVWDRISSGTKSNYGKHKRAHKRTEALSKDKVGATLSYAAKKEMISKKKCGKKVRYMPNGITEDVSGDEIPIPNREYSKGEAVKSPLEEVKELVEEGRQLLRKKIDPKFRPMNHSDAFQPLEDEKKQRQLLDDDKEPNDHNLSWIEVAALYHGVTVRHIERIVLLKLHAIDAHAYPSINLKHLLNMELSQ